MRQAFAVYSCAETIAIAGVKVLRESFVRLLACPYCGARLEIEVIRERLDGEIWSGSLACASCDTSFALRQGMAFLHREDASWESKAREAQGWVAIHKQKGAYEPSDAAVDLSIPYYDEAPWIEVGLRFDEALAQLQLTGDETVLDLGAGRGWAAKQFALLGCESVALDVAPDENVGLGRGRVLMEDAGVYFERVIGDGEHLPFQADSFDVVFCSAALHHASNLPLLLQNVRHVLKRGGRLCAIREPSLSILDDEQAELVRGAVEEMALGINETRPTYDEYMRALRRAGLQPSLVIPAPGLSMRDGDAQAWAQDLGAMWAWPQWRNPRRSLWRFWIYGKKRLQALLQGKLVTAGDGQGANSLERALQAVARWTTGELFVLAEKP